MHSKSLLQTAFYTQLQIAIDISDFQRQAAKEWSATAGDPSFRSLKEKPLQGVFLSKVFDTMLGYEQVVGHADSYNLKAETASKEIKGGKTPDARLGFFSASKDATRAVVELKGPFISQIKRFPNRLD